MKYNSSFILFSDIVLAVSKDNEGGLDGGAVAAIVLTCCLLAFVIVGAIIYIEYREHRRDRITSGKYDIRGSYEGGSPV